MKFFKPKRLVTIFLMLMMSNLVAQEEWELSSEEPGLKVWTKNIIGNPIKEFKLVALASGDIYQYTNALIDLEKLANWYDKVKSCKVEKVINDSAANYLLEFDLPWPIRDRYCQMYGEISYTDQYAIIKTKAYDGNKKSLDNLVRVTEMYSYWKIENIDEQNIKITHKGHFDPAGYLPDWLVNSAVTDSPKKSVLKLIKLAQNYPSEIKLPDL